METVDEAVEDVSLSFRPESRSDIMESLDIIDSIEDLRLTDSASVTKSSLSELVEELRDNLDSYWREWLALNESPLQANWTFYNQSSQHLTSTFAAGFTALM